MAEKTAIAWTDHTFNIAWGCTKGSGLKPGSDPTLDGEIVQEWPVAPSPGP